GGPEVSERTVYRGVPSIGVQAGGILMKAWLRRHWLFVAIVLVPTCSAIVYYGLIASDVYVSESRFLVRSPQHQAPSGLVGQLLQNTGLTPHSQDDTYSVRDYIL